MIKARKYKIIYADPPWPYRDKCHSGKRGVTYKYPTMDVVSIKNMRVPFITENNCALFLWCTSPQLPVGLDVMSAWGFEFKCIAFTWVKLNKNPVYAQDILGESIRDKYFPSNVITVGGENTIVKKLNVYSDFMGMGNYTRANAEFVLLGMRGKIKRVSRSVRSTVMTSLETHSKKPDIVRERIVELFGDIPRIELFARQQTQGWDVWGDMVENSLELEGVV